MAFPADLSNARLRGTYVNASGEPSRGTVSVRAAQRNAVGTSMITRAPAKVTLSASGGLDIPIPVGDDVDLFETLYLEIIERIDGEPGTVRYTVEVAAEDVEVVFENGQSIPVVYLTRVASIGGALPLNAHGYVRSVNGVTPDENGAVTIALGSGGGNTGGGGTGGAVSSVNGQVGTVVLTKSSIGLSNVDNLSASQLRDRSTHSGTQPVSTITDILEYIQDSVAAMIIAGSNVTRNYDDASGTLTINAVASGGGGGTGTDAEVVRDTIAAALIGSSGIQVTVDDANDTITLSISGISPSQITGATTVGRNVLTAVDAGTARTALGAGTSNLTVGTTSSTAKAGDYQPTAADISDATSTGRNVLKAASPTAARAAISASETGHTHVEYSTWAALRLYAARDPEMMIVGAVTRNSTTKAVTGGTVQWPDGRSGAFTATANTTTAVGEYDGYTVTWVDGSTTLTYTQPAPTRDSDGNITVLPAITVT